MKIGVISDIHGNIEALEAILKEFELQGVEKIICCGDMIGIGPYSEEVIQKMIQMKDKLIAVQGNHEGYLLNGLPEKVHDDKRKMSDVERANHLWTHKQLSDCSKQFIATLPLEIFIKVEDVNIYVVHYPYSELGTFQRMIKVPTSAECQMLFSQPEADIYLYGHTHSSWQVTDNDKFYLNFGAVGCPKVAKAAEAGIIEIGKKQITYQTLEVKYDISHVIQDIKALAYPMAEKLIEIFYE